MGLPLDSVNRSQLLDYTKCNNLGEVLELVIEMRKSLNIALAALKEIRDEGRTIDASHRANKALKELGE
jgi:hypothetical protein